MLGTETLFIDLDPRLRHHDRVPEVKIEIGLLSLFLKQAEGAFSLFPIRVPDGYGL
jgi:hypothetical protein